MNSDIGTAIVSLAKSAEKSQNALSAMQFAQAALSLAHAHEILSELEARAKEIK